MPAFRWPNVDFFDMWTRGYLEVGPAGDVVGFISHIAAVGTCALIGWSMLGVLRMSVGGLLCEDNSDCLRQCRDLRHARILDFAGPCGLLYKLGRNHV